MRNWLRKCVASLIGGNAKGGLNHPGHVECFPRKNYARGDFFIAVFKVLARE